MEQEIVESFALSPQQRHLWSFWQAGQGGMPYHARCVIHIEGRLDLQTLQAALDDIVNRHEILRTTFHCFEGLTVPTQVINDAGAPTLVCEDLRELSRARQEEKVEELERALWQAPFELERAPLMRAALVCLSPDEHLLIVALPSLCADAATLDTLTAELTRAYSASPHACDPPQYADLAAWQNDLLDGAETEAGRAFWERQDFSAVESSRLPGMWVGREAGAGNAGGEEGEAARGFRPERVAVGGGAELKAEIERAGQREGVSAGAMMLACWEAVLWRMSGGVSPLAVGISLDGREDEELKEALGPLSKVVPIVTPVSGETNLAELAREAEARLREARAYADYFSWERTSSSSSSSSSSLSSSSSPSSLSSSSSATSSSSSLSATSTATSAARSCALHFQDSWSGSGLHHPASHVSRGVTFTLRRHWACGEPFQLKLRCGGRVVAAGEAAGEVVGEAAGAVASGAWAEVEYDAAQVSQWQARAVAQALEAVVREVAASGEGGGCAGLRVGEVEMLCGEARREVVEGWNETEREYGREETVHEMFAAQAWRRPEAVAVVSGEEEVRYGELEARAEELARRLRGMGVGVEEAVGLYVGRGVAMVVGMLGIMKAGGCYVPLDPANPSERLLYMLRDSGAGVVLASVALAGVLEGSGARVVRLDEQGGWRVEGAQSEATEDVATESSDERRVGPGNLAYVIYTSGSTGRPKGVMVTHSAIVNRLRWGQDVYPLKEGDRVLQGAAFGFDFSVWEILAPLTTGACLVLPQSGSHQDSAALVELINREGITAAHFVPTLLQMVLQEREFKNCRSLKYVFSGGEALPYALQERFFDCLDATLYNQYGPTEATVDATFWLCRRDSELSFVPIGRPISNTQVYILNESLRPVPVGVAAELHIGGAGLARGYLNRPGLTAERFIPHPFNAEPGARLYKTGDLARFLPDGNVEFLGRLDHQVKIRGTRIELGEIEAVLLSHPGVQETVVLAREDAADDKRLVAYIVPRRGCTPAVGELYSFMKERIPEYMVPSAYVSLAALPLTPSGKVDRRRLPAPGSLRQESDEAYVAPHTVVEEMLAGIWARTLKLERVGMYDNFFELGGHSLLAMQLASRVRDAFEIELPLRSLFESPTIHGLAREIEPRMQARTAHGGGAQSVPPLLPVARHETLSASFGQQRLWLLHEMDGESPAYNIFTAIRLNGPLDPEALSRSLDEIQRRHEVLRTTFSFEAGQVVQLITEPETLQMPLLDLLGLPDEERKAELRRLAIEESRRPFDLSRGPMWRATLLRTGMEEHVLLLSVHHIVFDAWSVGVFMRELKLLYAAFKTNQPSPLPALPIQYADFAHWQREWLRGEVLETQLNYWKRQLAGADMILKLPTDRPRPASPTMRGARATLMLPLSLGDALKALSRQENVTLFMTLMAAFNVLMRHYSKQDDILVATNVAGRNRGETEGLVGFFVNMLVLRTSMEGDPVFRELLQQLRETTLGAYVHQDVPFEMLVDKLNVKRSLTHTPIFQVVFTLQNAPGESLEIPGLSVDYLDVEKETAKYDLVLNMFDTREGLIGSLAYSTDLFESSTINRMLEAFTALLQTIVARPEAKLSALSDALDATGKQQESLREETFDATRRRLFKNLKRKPVGVSPDIIS
jgi:amino acid adenylation domain-containing protein